MLDFKKCKKNETQMFFFLPCLAQLLVEVPPRPAHSEAE